MPKVAQETKSPRHSRRHNPLAEEYAPTEPFKLKAEKKRKHAEDKPGENDYVESKSSQRILQIGQDLVEEDQTERKKAEPNPAFAIESRSAPGAQEEDDRAAFEDEDEDEDDAWGDEEELAEEVEVDPNDQEIFNRFHPPADDPSTLFNTKDPTQSPKNADDNQETTNLAELILEKIAAHEAANSTQNHAHPNSHTQPQPQPSDEDEPLPEKVVEVYTKMGGLLSRHRSGPLPKPFKILPTLPPHQIPQILDLTRPEAWTPHAHFLAVRLFVSAKPYIAQLYLREILLPRIRNDISETKKLHVHLYNALKKALFKPACFFKGLLFPLLAEGDCTLREAHILSSVLARVSVPVLHSAAALLKLCDIAAEQFSVRKEDGGGGATNVFIRVLLEKKYALPYQTIDALVFHFVRFKALKTAGKIGNGEDVDMAENGTRLKEEKAPRLPVLWHQAFLAFAQRYRNDITEDQREALLDVVNTVGHRNMGPEIRRELLQGRGRGVITNGDSEMIDDGDDTMMLS